MIKVDKGKVSISGSKVDIQVELTHICRILIDEDFLSKDEIEECVRVGGLSPEELDAEIENELRQLKELVGLI